MKLRKKSFGILVAVLCLLALFQVNTPAADKGSVHVVVENTTYVKGRAATWSGTKVDANIEVTDDLTGATAIKKACNQAGVTYVAQESSYGTYFSDFDGLNANNALEVVEEGNYAGWRTMLNDWLTTDNLSAYKISDGTLKAGDEIKVVYSIASGADIGGGDNNNDKSLKALSFSTGTLSPAFSSTTKEYTLEVADGTKEVKVIPTATNKSFMVKTILGTKEYERTQMVPVENGTKLQVVCGKIEWPTGNSWNGASDVAAQTYTVTVKYVQETKNPTTATTATTTKTTVTKKKAAVGQVKIKKSFQFGSYLRTKWKKVKGADGYRVYIKKAGAKKYTRVYQCGSKKLSYTKKIGLTGKKYQVKVRAYKIVKKKKVFGAYSKAKTVKMKKLY